MNIDFDPKGTVACTPERLVVVLERQAQDMYLKNPIFCPFCYEGARDSGIDLEAGPPENLGLDMIIQPVTCGLCEAEWNDIYELTGYEKVVRN